MKRLIDWYIRKFRPCWACKKKIDPRYAYAICANCRRNKKYLFVKEAADAAEN